MKRLINAPSEYALDYLRGLALAHRDIIVLSESPLFVRRKSINNKKVMLVSGGGSGHEPMHCGFVGQGMLDLAIPGRIFSSPSANQIREAICSIDSEMGVLLLIKNYQGDIMNFEIASEQLTVPHKAFVISDDASADCEDDARGISGTIVYEKLIGAAAERGKNIDELVSLAEEIKKNIGSFGIQLSSPIHPELDAVDEGSEYYGVEFGVGIHGEKGIENVNEEALPRLIQRMLDPILNHIRIKPGERVLVLINGLGGTPQSELYIAFRYTSEQLRKMGIAVERSLIGSYATCLDSKGFSITLLRLNRHLTELWDDKVHTPTIAKH